MATWGPGSRVQRKNSITFIFRIVWTYRIIRLPSDTHFPAFEASDQLVSVAAHRLEPSRPRSQRDTQHQNYQDRALCPSFDTGHAVNDSDQRLTIVVESACGC